MKLYGILIYRWPLQNGSTSPKLVASGLDLSSFNVLQRGQVKEWALFFGKTLVQNSQPGSRQTVHHEDYGCHCQVRADGVSGVFITDKEYPHVIQEDISLFLNVLLSFSSFYVVRYVPRSAFVLQGQLLDDFCARYKGEWASIADPNTPMVDFPKIQDSGEADKVATVMGLIDETTIIMHKNIETALANGQKIDTLVDKSEDLSKHSKVFYKQAKKANRCCTIS